MDSIITYALLGITCLISYLALNQEKMMRDFMHFPYWEERSREFYRLLSAGFLHGDLMHLAFNMYALYGFGGLVERYFQYALPGGRWMFLFFYLSAIIVANIPTYFKQKGNSGFRSIGASGAVSAVIFAAILIEPSLKLMLFFIPIPIAGYIFGFLYLAYSSYASKNNSDSIDHEAHFWGAVYGLLFPAILQPSLISHFISGVTAQF
jgi:membrane associated rhomboid family serine protease